MCRAFGMVCSSEARCVGLLGWYVAQRLDVFDFPLSFPHVKFKINCC